MYTNIPGLTGHVRVEKIEDGTKVILVDKKNTLVKESPKIILSQLLTPSLVADSTAFDKQDNARPDVYAWASGPSHYNSVGYMHFGYYEDGEADPQIVVSSSDYALSSAADRIVKLPITSITVQEYSVKFVCQFQVTENTADYNYVEAALYTTGNNLDNAGTVLDPTDANYSSNTPLMFAHQSHTAVQASTGSTIVYTWTVAMQEPTN